LVSQSISNSRKRNKSLSMVSKPSVSRRHRKVRQLYKESQIDLDLWFACVNRGEICCFRPSEQPSSKRE